MRGIRLITAGLVATALVVCPNPLSVESALAQKVEKGQVGKSEKAERLEAVAAELLAEGETELWLEAAELLETAARIRPDSDIGRVEDLRTAANIWYWAGKANQARILTEEAALVASNLGKPALAANIYLDAAVLSAELKMGRHTIAAARQAELLAASPVVSSTERDAIETRLERLNAPRRLSQIM